MFVFLSIAFSISVLLAVLVIGSIFLACKSFEVVFAFVMILFCMDAITAGLPILFIGKNIQVFDPVSIILFFAGAIRLGFGAKKNIGWPEWLLVTLFALMSFPLFMGFRQYGMLAAPDFRFFFHFMALALYASSFDFKEIKFDRMATYMFWGATTLVLLTFFRWAADAVGLEIANSWKSVGANREFRVLNAAQSYVIMQTAFMLLIIYASNERDSYRNERKSSHTVLAHVGWPSFWRRWPASCASIGLAVSIALMHRSVWASLLSGAIVLAWIGKNYRRDLLKIFGTFTGTGIVILIPLGLMGFLDSFFDSLVRAFTETTEHHSSWADRYLGWAALLRGWWMSGDMLTYALGQPFGSGYYRRIAEFGSAYWVEYTPHNFYVQILLRTGIIGLLFIVALVFSSGFGVYRVASEMKERGYQYNIRIFLLLSVVMQAVFFLAYGARFEQGIIFGLAMTAVRIEIIPNQNISHQHVLH